MSSDSQDSLVRNTAERNINTTSDGNKNSNSNPENEPLISYGGIKRDGITRINMSAYAVGHVYNDF
jgi:hypothetical protein